MARKVLTNAEMQAIINSGGSVLINCKTHTVLATTISQLPDDNEILECFPLVPPPAFDEDDLNANAIGILGYFFSGTPTNGDSIKFNSTTGVWEFAPLGMSGIIGVAEGGTGLTTIPANSILYAGSLNTLSTPTLGSTLSVSSNIFNVVNDTSTQKLEISGNNNLVGTRKRINFVNGSNASISVTDDPTNNKVDIVVSASTSAGSRWDQLANPIGNLALSMGSSDTVLTWGNATAGNSLLQLRDSNGNNGNGVLLDLVSGTSSTINLFRATASGVSNGVVIDNTGKLSSIGSGNVEASQLKGMSSSGICVYTGSGFVSRQLSTGNANLSISNNNGVSGNITIGFSGSVVTGVSNETNITGSIDSNILTFAWAGTLAKNRQNVSTVYVDQSNTYVAGNKQIFVPSGVNAAFNISSYAGDPSSLSSGDFWQNSLTGKVRFYEQGTAYDLLQLVKGRNNLTDGTAISLFEVDLGPLTACAMVVNYAVYASDGTNMQVRSGSIRFSAVNKSGTIITESFISSEGVAPSIGTLTVDWSLVAGTNKVTVKALADSSLSANTFYIIYSVDNLSDRTITKL